MRAFIDGQRLWSSLMAMAEIGATDNGGSNRLALTPEDTAGRHLRIKWCKAMGCQVRSDPVGNLFIRRAGERDDLAPAALGSHLDTQPKGGRFDGVLGVLAGLEVFRTLKDHQNVTQRPLELHIEQGPVLEEEALDIGVVTGVQGMRWFDLTLEGSAAHAGTTPMAYRQDALAAAARLIDRVYTHVANDTSGESKATFGCLEIDTPSRNVIPATVTMTVDLRHIADDRLDALQTYFYSELEAVKEAFGVTVTLTPVWDSPVVAFDDGCIAAIEEAAKSWQLAYRRMPSGAGHDAVHVCRVAPTAMIFIPCRNGISHHEAEYSTPEQCALGIQVLCDALLQNANDLRDTP